MVTPNKGNYLPLINDYITIHTGNDRMVEGNLSVASDKDCNLWHIVASDIDPWGKMASNVSESLSNTRCLRLQMVRGTSDWLVIRLIRVMLLYQ